MNGLDFAYVKDRDQIWMIERGRGSRLLLKAPHAFFVSGEICGKELEGDPPAQPRVAGKVDLAHPASSKRADDLVWTDVSTGFDGQERAPYYRVRALSPVDTRFRNAMICPGSLASEVCGFNQTFGIFAHR